MKLYPDKSEKYSMSEVEPLIESILKANTGLTEEEICLELGYNGGYISQLRSREKTSGEPQVSPKFYKQLHAYTLHNARSYAQNNQTGEVNEDPAEYEITGKWYGGKEQFIRALLDEKDRAINKAEEFAKKMEAHYQDAKGDKEKLFIALNNLQHTFDNTLKEISGNLKEAAVSLVHNRELLTLLKDQTYIVSDQLERQSEILESKAPVGPFVKKGNASADVQQEDLKKGKRH